MSGYQGDKTSRQRRRTSESRWSQSATLRDVFMAQIFGAFVVVIVILGVVGLSGQGQRALSVQIAHDTAEAQQTAERVEQRLELRAEEHCDLTRIVLAYNATIRPGEVVPSITVEEERDLAMVCKDENKEER